MGWAWLASVVPAVLSMAQSTGRDPGSITREEFAAYMAQRQAPSIWPLAAAGGGVILLILLLSKRKR